MNNFTQRIITGTIFIAVMVTFVLINQYSFIFLFFIIHLLGLKEFYHLLYSSTVFKGTKFILLRNISACILSSSLFITMSFMLLGYSGATILLTNLPLAFVIFASELYLNDKTPFINLGVSFLGIIYITIPIICINCIAFIPFENKIYHPYLILGYLIIVWAHDSGAYMVGKLFGKNSLFKRISPNKTWEGSFGGACYAFIGAAVAAFLDKETSLIQWEIIALIVIIAGTYGDLIKSLLKRSVNVKDSGSILPGHGGILDRFDSLMSSALFVFCYLYIFK